MPNPLISEDSPTLTEVREVIYNPKGGKAAGISDIAVNFFSLMILTMHNQDEI